MKAALMGEDKYMNPQELSPQLAQGETPSFSSLYNTNSKLISGSKTHS
jgi:hypothetical protein